MECEILIEAPQIAKDWLKPVQDGSAALYELYCSQKIALGIPEASFKSTFSKLFSKIPVSAGQASVSLSLWARESHLGPD